MYVLVWYKATRADLLHMTTKEQNIHKEYLPDSYVLVHYRTGLPPTRLHTNWKGPMRVIKGLNSRYTLLDLITTNVHPVACRPSAICSVACAKGGCSTHDCSSFVRFILFCFLHVLNVFPFRPHHLNTFYDITLSESIP